MSVVMSIAATGGSMSCIAKQMLVAQTAKVFGNPSAASTCAMCGACCRNCARSVTCLAYYCDRLTSVINMNEVNEMRYLANAALAEGAVVSTAATTAKCPETT